jgi:hypothetical protein
METVKIPMDESLKTCTALQRRVELRLLSAEEFINRHASGTLRKNRALGMVWRSQYLEERTAYEFGWEFECLPRSRVTFGDAYTEGDCAAITEAGWFCERYLSLAAFPGDRLEVKYLNVEYSDERKREGIGLIVRETSAVFVPEGHLVFAIVAEYDPVRKRFKAARNPC